MVERRREKKKQRAQEQKRHKTGSSDEDDSSPSNQSGTATDVTNKGEDEGGSSSRESSRGKFKSPSDSEGETAYEQSFDARVVRLGKAFVLHGCPWIKGGEWDEVEAVWDEPDIPDPLDPTLMLKNYLKQEGVVFQTWRKEGFESAVRLSTPYPPISDILMSPCSSSKGCGPCDQMRWRPLNGMVEKSLVSQA